MAKPCSAWTLDAQHHALAIDVRHLEVGDLGHTQAGAIGHAEGGLVLRPGSCLDQREDLLRGQNHRQLPRLLHEPQMPGHLRPVTRRREKEPQRRRRAVHGRRLHALLALVQLEPAQILRLGCIRRTAEEDCEVLNVADVIALRLLAEAADGHVLDHPAAKRADGLGACCGLAHWGAPGLEVGGSRPLDPRDRHFPFRYRLLSSTPMVAVSPLAGV